MENNPQIEAGRLPLKMERTEKLKCFAILSKHNSLPHELVNEKLILSVILSYSAGDAVQGAIVGLEQTGKKAEEYKTPYMIIGRELMGLIQIEPGHPWEDLFASPEEMRQAGIEAGNDPKTKLPADLIAYVRYVFNIVATATQKKTAEDVIIKFQEHAKGVSTGN